MHLADGFRTSDPVGPVLDIQASVSILADDSLFRRSPAETRASGSSQALVVMDMKSDSAGHIGANASNVEAATTDASDASTAWKAARAALESRYQIDSAFLRVGDLSRMMGIAGNSVRCQIREGRFPIAHRRIGNVVVVKFDDFVDWYCGAGDVGRMPAQQETQSEASLPASYLPSVATNAPALVPYAETPRDRAARIKREVLEGMRRRGEWQPRK